MATEDEDHAAFNDDDDDLEDTDDTDMEDFDEDDHTNNSGQTSPPSPPPPTSVDIHPPNPNPNTNSTIGQSFSDLNGAIQITPISSSAGTVGAGGGDQQTRRLFQRLWTDDDEIKILKGFLEFTSSRGTTFASHQYDTGPFYEQIKNELQLDFNKNQLIEKLRRLKKKYRNTANRMASHGNRFSFKTPHEMMTYEIAKKIWSASIVKLRESDEDDGLNNSYSNNVNSNSDLTMTMSSTRSRRRGRKRSLEMPTVLPLPVPPPPPPVENVVKVEVLTSPVTTPTPTPIPIPIPTPITQEVSISNCNTTVANPSIPNVIEETVKSCLSPIFKELLSSAVNSVVGGSMNPGLGLKLPPLLNFGGDFEELASDERWKKQRILELEVYLKRVELVREQIKATLEELKGSLTELASES